MRRSHWILLIAALLTAASIATWAWTSTGEGAREPVRDGGPSWSPDGTRIAFVSDLDGEEEIYVVDERGTETPVQLTDGSRGRYYALVWSPDSSSIAFRNQAGKLFVI